VCRDSSICPAEVCLCDRLKACGWLHWCSLVWARKRKRCSARPPQKMVPPPHCQQLHPLWTHRNTPPPLPPQRVPPPPLSLRPTWRQTSVGPHFLACRSYLLVCPISDPTLMSRLGYWTRRRFSRRPVLIPSCSFARNSWTSSQQSG